MNYDNFNNKQLSMIDILSILSFCISVMNFDENLSQTDKQDLQKDLSDKMNIILKEIHQHLEKQDIKINQILEEIKK